jgi:hypothetical protein
MKRPFAKLAAAAIPLFLSSMGAFASEPQFKVPSTVRAEQTADLLARAASGFTTVEGGGQIQNLWLFPTNDADTVFARYTSASSEHLALVTLRGDRIVEVRDLTAEPATHWSAGIGNGHTSSTTTLNTSAKGTPASPHWSARIGTGQQTDGSDASSSQSKDVKQAQSSKVAGPHWTASIGTARARSFN